MDLLARLPLALLGSLMAPTVMDHFPVTGTLALATFVDAARDHAAASSHVDQFSRERARFAECRVSGS
jgi:hypothetical protein